MKRRNFLLILAASLVLMGTFASRSAVADSLYIGDAGDDTVKRYDAATGAFISVFVASGSGGLHGPRGILFDDDGNLLVANQNVNLPIPGAILRFDGTTGTPLPDLVSSSDENAPTAPHGIIVGAKLYVADLLRVLGADNTAKGRIRTYDDATGAFLGDLKVKGFDMSYEHPNALVVSAADGALYVSLRDLRADSIGGFVLRFNPDGSFDRVFIADRRGGVGHLNRPRGLVFGPDGNLYITSFRADATDTSSIRIYSPGGAFLGKIDLDTAFGPTTRAQSILFGPKDCLFVPIYDTGEVRRYNVGLGTCDAGSPYDVLVPAGGPLIQPWFVTFGNTDSQTLEYEE
jgi:DNA-binding beta-propeller fold protein YncE